MYTRITFHLPPYCRLDSSLWHFHLPLAGVPASVRWYRWWCARTFLPHKCESDIIRRGRKRIITDAQSSICLLLSRQWYFFFFAKKLFFPSKKTLEVTKSLTPKWRWWFFGGWSKFFSKDCFYYPRNEFFVKHNASRKAKKIQNMATKDYTYFGKKMQYKKFVGFLVSYFLTSWEK